MRPIGEVYMQKSAVEVLCGPRCNDRLWCNNARAEVCMHEYLSGRYEVTT